MYLIKKYNSYLEDEDQRLYQQDQLHLLKHIKNIEENKRIITNLLNYSIYLS